VEVLFVLAGLAAIVGVRAWLRRGQREPSPDRGPVGWCPGTRWRVLEPLARADTRRLLLHPAFLVGVAVTPLMLWAATYSDSDDSGRSISANVALSLVPLGWFAIIATDLLVLRPSRSGASELFATLPAPQPVRTAGVLATAGAAVVIAAVFAVGWTIMLWRGEARVGSPDWGETAAGVLVVAGGAVVGVAVGRWLRFAVAGVAAVVAVILLQARFLDDTTWPWNRTHRDPLRFLGFLAAPTAVDDAALEIRPTVWHLVYLAALVIVMALVALARDGMTRPLGGALAASLSIVGVAGWVQTRPPSERQVAAMVGFVTDPTAHQVCDTRRAVRYCAYPESSERVDEWQARVEGVLALVPAPDAGAGLQVLQRIPWITGDQNCQPTQYLHELPARVAERLVPEAVWPDDGHVHPDDGHFPCSDRVTNGMFTAVQAAAWAVGLPPSPHGEYRRCTADGQARAALALWLGAAATPDGAALLADIAAEHASTDGALTFDEWDDPPMWGVVYQAADAELAEAMLTRPPAEVADALAAEWARWIDRATTSADLAAHLGLAQPGATPRGATCA